MMSWEAALAATFKAAGPVLGGVSAYQRGIAASKTYQAIGQQAQLERQKQGTALLASQRVAFAKSGIDIGTGTPVDVGVATAASEALAARRIRYAYDQAASQIKLQGESALLAGLLQATASAIGSAGELGFGTTAPTASSGAPGGAAAP